MRNNKYLVDANIFLRHLRQDHAVLSQQASHIIEDIAEGKIRAHMLILTVHEVIYVLEHIYKKKRSDIVQSLKKILKLRNLILLDSTKEELEEIFVIYENKNVDFLDCVYAHIATSENMEILSFDRDFKKLKVIVSDKI